MRKLLDWFKELFDPLKHDPDEAFTTREEVLKMFAAEEEEEEWDED